MRLEIRSHEGEILTGLASQTRVQARPLSRVTRWRRTAMSAAPHLDSEQSCPTLRWGDLGVGRSTKSEGFRAHRSDAEGATGGHSGESFSGNSGELEGQGLEGRRPNVRTRKTGSPCAHCSTCNKGVCSHPGFSLFRLINQCELDPNRAESVVNHC